MDSPVVVLGAAIGMVTAAALLLVLTVIAAHRTVHGGRHRPRHGAHHLTFPEARTVDEITRRLRQEAARSRRPPRVITIRPRTASSCGPPTTPLSTVHLAADTVPDHPIPTDDEPPEAPAHDSAHDSAPADPPAKD